MEFKLFGQKLRLEIVIISMLLGAFIAMNSWCSCAGGIKEGFSAAAALAGGSPLEYTISNGVPVSWESKNNKHDPHEKLEAHTSEQKPLENDSLSMFAGNTPIKTAIMPHAPMLCVSGNSSNTPKMISSAPLR